MKLIEVGLASKIYTLEDFIAQKIKMENLAPGMEWVSKVYVP